MTTTNLAKQLRAIKHAKASVGDDLLSHIAKIRPSVMFDPKEAADYDLDAIYEVGLTGLFRLNEISGNAFSRFQKSLFSESFKGFNRSFKSKSENDKLDKEISSFCEMLVPFFRDDAAAKVLEYLIRAFRVEEMNVDLLLLNFLPYHSTELYGKLLGIIRVADHERWNFLAKAKKKSISPDRAFIVSRCCSDYSLMGNYVTTVVSAVKANPKLNYKNSLSFLTCLFLDIITATKTFDDTFIRNFLCWILKGLEPGLVNTDLQLACCLGFVHLCSSTLLSSEAVTSVLNEIIVRAAASGQSEEFLFSVFMIFEKQKASLPEFPVKGFTFMVKCQNLVSCLISFAAQGGNIKHFVTLFMEKLSSSISKHENYLKLWIKFLSATLFESYVTAENVVLVLMEIAKGSLTTKCSEEDGTAVRSLLTQRFPSVLDKALKIVLRKADSECRENLFLFFSNTVSKIQYSCITDSSSSFMSDALASPEESIRILAIKKIESLLEENGSRVTDFTELFLPSLHDKSAKILSVAWSLKPLLAVVHVEKLFEEFFRVVKANTRLPLKAVSLIITQVISRIENESQIAQTMAAVVEMLMQNDDKKVCQSINQAITENKVTLKYFGEVDSKATIHEVLSGNTAIHHSINEILLKSGNPKVISLALHCLVQGLLNSHESFQDQVFWVRRFMEFASNQGNNSTPEISNLITSLLEKAITAITKENGSNWFSGVSAYAKEIKNIYSWVCNSNLNEKVRVNLIKSLIQHQLKNDLCQFLCSVIGNKMCTSQEAIQSLILMRSFLKSLKVANMKLNLQLLITPIIVRLLEGSSTMERKSCMDCISLIQDLLDPTSQSQTVHLRESFYGSEQKAPADILSTETLNTLLKSLLSKYNELIAEPNATIKILFQAKDVRKKSKKEMLNFWYQHLPLLQRKNLLADITAGIGSAIKINLFSEIIMQEVSNPDFDAEWIEKLFFVFNDGSHESLNSTGSKSFIRLKDLIETGTEKVIGIVIKSIKSEVIRALNSEKQLILLKSFLNAAIRIPGVFIGIRDYLRSLSLLASVYSSEILRLVSQIKTDAGAGSKRVKTTHNDLKANFDSVVLLIESLRDRQDLIDRYKLISCLFELFDCVVNSDLDSKLLSLDYAKQLILSQIQEILSDKGNDWGKIDKRSIRVELLVQGLRCTANPQIHNQIFVIFSIIAEPYPHKVLNNIMPILTFMGANTLRQDDSFTSSVIQRTIKSVIPIMINKQKVTGDGVSHSFLLEMKDIFQIFVDNFNHIPKFRQLDVFSSICEFQQDELFFLLLSQFCERIVRNMESGNQMEIEALQEFVVSLCSHAINGKTLFLSFMKLVEDLMKIPIEEVPAPHIPICTVYSIKTNSYANRMQYRVTCMEMISFILAQIRHSTLDVDQKEDNEHDIVCAFTESCLKLGSTAAEQNIKSSKMIVALTYDCLKQMSRMISFESLILIVKRLMGKNNFVVKEKALLFFSDRLQDLEESNLSGKEPVESLFRDIITSVEKDIAVDRPVLLQSCYYSMDLVVKKFSCSDEVLLSCVEQLIGVKGIDHGNELVAANALLCLSSVTGRLGPRMLSHLNPLMKTVIKNLESVSQGPASLLYIACLQMLKSLFSQIPLFLTPFIKQCMVHLFIPAEIDGDIEHVKLIKSLSKDVLEMISGSVEPRTIVPIMVESFPVCTTGSNIGQFFSFFGSVIRSMDRKVVSQFNASLFRLFLSCLDFPETLNVSPVPLEDNLLSAFKEYVLKLSESTFNPIFHKLVNWTTIDDDDSVNTVLRHRMFYRLCEFLLDVLKSLFSPYFHVYAENWLAILSTFDSGAEFIKPEDQDQGQGEINVELEDFKVRMDLWKFCVNVSRKSLIYSTDDTAPEDQGGFEEEKYLLVGRTLIAQMEMFEDNEILYLERMKTNLIPAITQVLVTSNTDAIWKPLNQRVLQYIKHGEPAIRKAAILCIKEFYVRLGEDFLVLLPESIPTLAEMMEDDDEDVERYSQDLVKTIENFLGEPLQKYFTNKLEG